MSGAPAPARAIEARALERRFGRFQALAGIDLEVEQGATVALLGANGAGKTTLLRILAQVLRATSGEVAILGRSIRREPEAVLRSLGLVTHAAGLYLDLTALENVAFSARLYGLPEPERQAREALAEVRLDGDAAYRLPVRSLSRGLLQRAALARALVHRPPIVLLDEPWTGLDRGAQQVLSERLAADRSRGVTTIFTTHDLRAGYDSAERVVVLDRGRIVIDARRDALPFEELERVFASGGGGARS